MTDPRAPRAVPGFEVEATGRVAPTWVAGRSVCARLPVVVAFLGGVVFVMATGRGESLQPTLGVWTVVVAAWWASPVVAMAACVASRAFWLVAVVEAVAAAWCLRGMYASDSSTVGIGFLTVPILLWLPALVTIAIDAFVTSRSVDPFREADLGRVSDV